MRKVISGRRVVVTLGVVVLATVVVPPAGAWWLNQRRIGQTQARAEAALAAVVPRDRAPVVCGPGRLPDQDVVNATAVHAAWLAAAVVAPDAFGPSMPTDAWGRCFLMNERWLLSAGPNGVIDTAFDAGALQGDDVGVRRP